MAVRVWFNKLKKWQQIVIFISSIIGGSTATVMAVGGIAQWYTQKTTLEDWVKFQRNTDMVEHFNDTIKTNTSGIAELKAKAAENDLRYNATVLQTERQFSEIKQSLARIDQKIADIADRLASKDRAASTVCENASTKTQ
jgi:hypothetical protein